LGQDTVNELVDDGDVDVDDDDDDDDDDKDDDDGGGGDDDELPILTSRRRRRRRGRRRRRRRRQRRRRRRRTPHTYSPTSYEHPLPNKSREVRLQVTSVAAHTKRGRSTSPRDSADGSTPPPRRGADSLRHL
jgi:hypothetical protein